MSRNTLTPHPQYPDHEIIVGWDPCLSTYYVQVLCPSTIMPGEDEEVVCEGMFPGQYPTPQSVLDIAARFAVIPDSLSDVLRLDRAAEGDTERSPRMQDLVDALLARR